MAYSTDSTDEYLQNWGSAKNKSEWNSDAKTDVFVTNT
jgi:hypothetical protein